MLAGILLLWPQPHLPFPLCDGRRNSTEQIGRSQEKGKNAPGHGPQPSYRSPPTTRLLPQPISLLRHTGQGPPMHVPLGSPCKSLVSQPCPFSISPVPALANHSRVTLPFQHQPSPCPCQSLQGDCGQVTPGAPLSITRSSPPADPSSTSLGSLRSCLQEPGFPSPRPHPRQSSLGDFGLVTPGVPCCRLCPPLLLPQGQPPWALCAGVSKDLGPNPVFPSPIVEW